MNLSRAIIQRIKEDRFYEEDEYYYNGARIKYEIVFDYKSYLLYFYDITGSIKYHSITSTVILLVYDVKNKESFEALQTFLIDNRLILKDKLIIVVGTKNDLQGKKEISDIKVKNFAEENNLLFTTVSSKTGEGIKTLVNMIINNFLKKTNENIRLLVHKNTKIKPSCNI